MPPSAADEALLADMRQRELHLKARHLAADAIRHRMRRFRRIFITLVGLVGAIVGVGVFFVVDRAVTVAPNWQRLLVFNIVLAAVIGMQLGAQFLRSRPGRRLLAHYEARLRRRYASELQAARRWSSFYYQDEEISAYVPQILYFIESERRFDSIGDALAFAKANRRTSAPFAERAERQFKAAAAEVNVAVVSSTDAAGTPTSRLMRFVKSDRPHVWYTTAAPEGHRIHEFDHRRIAILTAPTDAGATISSNRVQIKRADVGLAEIADLYRAQVPGYVDNLTDEEVEREIVYELTLQSAKVQSWLDTDIIDFDDPTRDT